VHRRQVAVEDDHVVGGHGDAIKGAGAVVGHVDGHRLPAQTPGDGVGQHLLVLHHQHSHLVPHAVGLGITVA
jgi:hypothetical protein